MALGVMWSQWLEIFAKIDDTDYLATFAPVTEPRHPGRLLLDCGGDPSQHCPLTADYDATLRGRDLPPEDNSDSP